MKVTENSKVNLLGDFHCLAYDSSDSNNVLLGS